MLSVRNVKLSCDWMLWFRLAHCTLSDEPFENQKFSQKRRGNYVFAESRMEEES